MAGDNEVVADSDWMQTWRMALAERATAIGGQAAQAVSYLGVPDGYKPPRNRPSTASPFGSSALEALVPPRPMYTEQDILKPVQFGRGKIAEIQKQLARAGLYGGGQARYRNGVWDEVTQAAYQQALIYANQNGLDINDAIDDLIRNPMPKDPRDKEPVKPGRIDKLTDADTLEAQVQAAAERNLGRKLRKSEITKFVTLYQGLERKDNAAYGKAVETAEGGQDVTFQANVGSADVEAEEFVGAEHAQEAAGQDAYGYFDALKSLLGG